MTSYDSPYPVSQFSVQSPHHDYAKQEKIRKRREEGLQKVKTFGFVQLCLSVVLGACGIATIVVASDNIGFPVFNPGPLVTAIIIFISGGLGFYAGRTGLEELRHGDVQSSTNCMIRGNFGLSVAVMSIGIISGIFAFISGAICAGAGITFTRRYNGQSSVIDPSPYCEPNKKSNAVLAIIDGVLCLLVVVWACLGLCMFCAYGQLFGIRKRRRYLG